MPLKASELFGFVIKFNVVDAYFESEDTLYEVYNIVETPLKGSRDLFMHEDFPSPVCDIIIPNLPDHFDVSPLCSLPSPSLSIILMTPLIILCL